jgi:periplasmic protein TonB
MFERTLDSSWHERSHRGFTALTSFALQVLAVGLLIVLPLLHPQGLPLFRRLSSPVSLGQPVSELPEARPHSAGVASLSSLHPQIVLRQPSQIPNNIPPAADDAQISSGSNIPGTIPGPGVPGGLVNSMGTAAPPVMPAPPVAHPHTIRLSHMSEGSLVRKILPAYPPLARSARIQGTVVLLATISKDGAIENLRLLSGHPMLSAAAIEAVRQWRYRPYILNNEPLEVETQITVNFSLAGN